MLRRQTAVFPRSPAPTLSVPTRIVHGMESIEVAIVGDVPASFIGDGRTWHVGAEPVRWYERQPWWETTRRAPKGGDLRIDVVVWQVQARSAGIHARRWSPSNSCSDRTGKRGRVGPWSRCRWRRERSAGIDNTPCQIRAKIPHAHTLNTQAVD